MTINEIFDNWGLLVGIALIGLPFIIASIYVFFGALFDNLI